MEKQDDWPCLKSKAASCATVSIWLAEKAQDIVTRHDTQENRMRAIMLKGFADLWNMSRECDVLNDAEKQRLELTRQRMLLGYHACSKMAHERGDYRYNMIPKFHKTDHMIRRAVRTGLSPSFTWTFSEEDNMRWMSNLCASVHGLGFMKAPVNKMAGCSL